MERELGGSVSKKIRGLVWRMGEGEKNPGQYPVMGTLEWVGEDIKIHPHIFLWRSGEAKTSSSMGMERKVGGKCFKKRSSEKAGGVWEREVPKTLRIRYMGTLEWVRIERQRKVRSYGEGERGEEKIQKKHLDF